MIIINWKEETLKEKKWSTFLSVRKQKIWSRNIINKSSPITAAATALVTAAHHVLPSKPRVTQYCTNKNN